MRLIGCMNGYQDEALLTRSLPALRRVVDVVVYVDGAYAGFPPYDPRTSESVDGSVDLARAYADVIILPPTPRGEPWPNEIVKRSAYLIGRRDDYYLVVDADEVVEILREDGSLNPLGKLDYATLTERADWMVTLKRAGDSTAEYPIHRLFRHREGIRYHGTHHAVHVGDAMIHPSALEREVPDSVFPRLRLSHLWDKRDADRVERKGVYYTETLNESEREFRAAHGLGR